MNNQTAYLVQNLLNTDIKDETTGFIQPIYKIEECELVSEDGNKYEFKSPSEEDSFPCYKANFDLEEMQPYNGAKHLFSTFSKAESRLLALIEKHIFRFERNIELWKNALKHWESIFDKVSKNSDTELKLLLAQLEEGHESRVHHLQDHSTAYLSIFVENRLNFHNPWFNETSDFAAEPYYKENSLEIEGEFELQDFDGSPIIFNLKNNDDSKLKEVITYKDFKLTYFLKCSNATVVINMADISSENKELMIVIKKKFLECLANQINQIVSIIKDTTEILNVLKNPNIYEQLVELK